MQKPSNKLFVLVSIVDEIEQGDCVNIVEDDVEAILFVKILGDFWNESVVGETAATAAVTAATTAALADCIA